MAGPDAVCPAFFTLCILQAHYSYFRFQDFVETYRIGTTDEATKLMTDEAFLKPGKLRLVEVCLPRCALPASPTWPPLADVFATCRDDVPALLATAKESVSDYNAFRHSGTVLTFALMTVQRPRQIRRLGKTQNPRQASQVSQREVDADTPCDGYV